MKKHVLHIALLCLLLVGALLLASCEQARSIVKSEIVNGELILTYSDGTVDNLGAVVGEQVDRGETGATGAAGITPQLRVNEETNEWQVSYDNGDSWESTGVVATGAQGATGATIE